MLDWYHEGASLNDFHHREGPRSHARIREPHDGSLEQLSAGRELRGFLWARQKNVSDLEAYLVTLLRKPPREQNTS